MKARAIAGFTPLHLFVQFGELSIVEYKSGQSLFEFAIKQCHDSENSMNDRFSIFKFMVLHGALHDIPVELLHSVSPLHKHPLTLAVELDLSSVVCVLSSHLSESLIRQMFQIYLKRFPGSLKVIKKFCLRFFNSFDDNFWLFSILTYGISNALCFL